MRHEPGFESRKRLSTMNRNGNQKAMVRGPRQNLRKQNGATRRSSAMAPPPFKAIPERSGKVRFIATAGVSGDFTQLDLFDLPGCSAQTAISGIPISQAVRLRKVEVWAPVQTAGSTTTCSLFDDSGAAGTALGGLPEVISDSSMSFDRPAHLVWTTKPTRPSGGWWTVASTSISRVLFNLICPLGSVVDVSFDFVINLTAQAGLAPAVVIVGATPGDLFNRVAITNLTPQSVLVL
jgi:hypothetical protein